MLRRPVAILLLCLVPSASPAVAHDRNVAAAACLREAFLKATSGHDTIYSDPALPPSYSFDLGKRDARAYFGLVADVWREATPGPDLDAVTDAILAWRAPSPPSLAAFGIVRARLKELRFAFQAFDREHACPKRLDRLAIDMGHLRDALTYGNATVARKTAKRIRDFRADSGLQKIGKELEGFRPADRDSFRDWLRGEAKFLRKGLEPRSITWEHFHSLRKTVGAVMTVVEAANVLDPDPNADALLRVLSTLDGRMGEVHNTEVGQAMTSDTDLDETFMTVPADIAALTAKLAEFLR